ncbi:uncharacterized protein [Neodiprion pinetum]|uniref:uncharacterized protein n=1 Tax=Neodiprion pinetum TaxID=441929 RepID=UPI0037232B53
MCKYIDVCHVNAQSLVSHIDEFRGYFSSKQYHIIAVSESWLKPHIADQAVHLPDYNILRCDRTGIGGGGVALYVHRSLKAKVLVCSSSAYSARPEFLIAEISSACRSKLAFSVVYRPPKIGYMSDFEEAFLQYSQAYKSNIVMGDFNADLCSNSFDANNLKSFFSSVSMDIVPYCPTHHTATSSTWLDVCAVNDLSKVSGYSQLPVAFLSSHDLISVSFLSISDKIEPREIICRDFKLLNSQAFKLDIEACDWSQVFTATSIDAKVDLLNTFVLETINKHAPVRKAQLRRPPAPWLDNNIKTLMRERDALYKAFRRTRSLVVRDKYRVLRGRVKACKKQTLHVEV